MNYKSPDLKRREPTVPAVWKEGLTLGRALREGRKYLSHLFFFHIDLSPIPADYFTPGAVPYAVREVQGSGCAVSGFLVAICGPLEVAKKFHMEVGDRNSGRGVPARPAIISDLCSFVKRQIAQK